ncbi:unnamed protein product, partial [Candidula unifasciata]
QCPLVSSSYSLDYIYCSFISHEHKCITNKDCNGDNEKCCPNSCGSTVCKKVYSLK